VLPAYPLKWTAIKGHNKSMKDFLYLLSQHLEADLDRLNPWWHGNVMPPLPKTKRWAFPVVLKNIQAGIAPVIVVRGPRQVGKSILMKQIIDRLLLDGVPASHILHVQFDEIPELLKTEETILRLADWHERKIMGKTYNQASKENKPAYLFLDEVQNLSKWAPQVKFLVDSSSVRIMITGSSALRIEKGRDSLAGRLTTLDIGPLLLREVSEFQGQDGWNAFLPYNGLAPMKEKQFWLDLKQFGERYRDARLIAFRAFSERGAYPVAHQKKDMPWEVLADHLNETVIQRVIQHDLQYGEPGRKRDPHLLEEVFRLSCRYVGQSPKQSLYLDEVKRAMNANIGWQRVLTYLKFLDGSLLIRLIEPLEIRNKKRRGASKLCLCDHALRASWLHEVIPIDVEGLERANHLSDLAGHIAESTAGYFLDSITNLQVKHFPERAVEPEVDYIITIGEQRIPVEIKYRKNIRFEDTRGLRSFMEKSVYNAPFGLLVTLQDESSTDDPRIVSMPLSTFLMLR